MAHNFAYSDTNKRNVDQFLTNLLMKPITKDFLYCNADEWLEKLSVIPLGIADDKKTKHKFEIKNGVDKLAGQNMAIQF